MGGRWNSPGTPLLYASAVLSLAVLEVLVHVDVDVLPADLTAYEIEFPDGLVEQIDVTRLSARWDPRAILEGRRTFPSLDRTRAVGDAWAREARSLALAVPSAVLPIETNVLLNPEHAAAGELRIVATYPFTFDPRLGGLSTSG